MHALSAQMLGCLCPYGSRNPPGLLPGMNKFAVGPPTPVSPLSKLENIHQKMEHGNVPQPQLGDVAPAGPAAGPATYPPRPISEGGFHTPGALSGKPEAETGVSPEPDEGAGPVRVGGTPMGEMANGKLLTRGGFHLNPALPGGGPAVDLNSRVGIGGGIGRGEGTAGGGAVDPHSGQWIPGISNEGLMMGVGGVGLGGLGAYGLYHMLKGKEEEKRRRARLMA